MEIGNTRSELSKQIGTEFCSAFLNYREIAFALTKVDRYRYVGMAEVTHGSGPFSYLARDGCRQRVYMDFHPMKVGLPRRRATLQAHKG